MVNRVNDSFRGHNQYQYRELNNQLARELERVNQRNAQAEALIHQRGEEILALKQQHLQDADTIRRNCEQILELKQQLKDFALLKEKYDAIKNIILDKPLDLPSSPHIRAIEAAPEPQREVLSLPGPEVEPSRIHPTTSIEVSASHETQGGDQHDEYDDDSLEDSQGVVRKEDGSDEIGDDADDVDDEDDNDHHSESSISTCDAAEAVDRLSEMPLHTISERSGEGDEEEQDVYSNKDQSNHTNIDDANQSRATEHIAINVSQTSTVKSAPRKDSFDLSDENSVPPIDQPSERTLRISSVWNCLDPIEKTPPKSAEKNPESPKLRESNNITMGSTTCATSSPIHPVNAKPTGNNVCNTNSQIGDIFHSTPRAKRKELPKNDPPPTRYNLRKRTRK